MGSAEVTVPITELLVKELNVKGSFRYGVSISVLRIKTKSDELIAWRLRAVDRACGVGQD